MNSKKSLHITLVLFVLHVVISYMGMLTIYGPYTISEVSGMYPHLLTPAGFTFAIWGIIYVGLALQLGYHYKNTESQVAATVWQAIGYRLALVHVATILWLVAWCQAWLVLANVFIVLQLVVVLQALIRVGATHPRGTAFWLSATPLAIYAGWLCIATVANTACTLVAHTQVSLPAESIAKIVVITVALVTLGTLFQTRLVAFAVPIAWAFWGIYKAVQTAAYPSLRYTLVAGIILVLTTALVVGISLLKSYAKPTK
jgi:translocator protein